ncbi:MAG: carboxymuconolactone decarboxylase family protein [Cyanobacteria bacterium P01_E01_bin.48]
MAKDRDSSTKQAGQSRLEKGLAVRSEVLGSDYVEAALSSDDSFWHPVQAMVSEYCWGYVWTRDGLDRRTRSLLNLAILSALNRPHEVELHLRGALTNGCTPEDIREVTLQVAAYCGVPAAIDTMRIAKRVFAEEKVMNDTP